MQNGNTSQQQAMIDAFRRRLRSEPQLLREFLDAPMGILGREGVQVSPQAAQQLRNEVAAWAPEDTQ